jgi:hypothetical protein
MESEARLSLRLLHVSASVVGIVTFVVTFASSKNIDVALGVMGIGYFVLLALVGVGLMYVVVADLRNGAYRLSLSNLSGLAWMVGMAVVSCWVLSDVGYSDVHRFGVLQIVGLVVAGIVAFSGTRYLIATRRDRWKECPDCANKALAKARKCEHCGYVFPEAPAPVSKAT